MNINYTPNSSMKYIVQVCRYLLPMIDSDETFG